MSAPPTPEELALLPHDDRGPVILGVHWTLTVFATIFLGLRIYAKRLTGRSLWWDDWILLGAWVTIIVTGGLTTTLVVENGLGHHSWDLRISDLAAYIKIISARATFTLTTLGWTKTSFGITLLRLTKGRTKAFVWFCIVTINITTFISALVPWIQCEPISKTWNPMEEGWCWAPKVGTKVWIGMGAYGALMDFTLAALPWTILRDVKLKLREKIGVIAAMSMGIIAGAFAIAKCIALPNLGSGDAYNEVELFNWDIAEGTVTMMAACIPTLRVLVRERRLATSQAYRLGNNSNSNGYPFKGSKSGRGTAKNGTGVGRGGDDVELVAKGGESGSGSLGWKGVEVERVEGKF
ncbi:hypothetical protein B0T14DRAFT_599372 [Immersiella caudata]|uniref:Rhodopsin domain-containing protein n=1 Tax=Immersiella caudata TaxID=314043 RepID=A0AA39X231_9PEZI|nr:hypothetical protein B0T14DRAFT_599372 [Immersiella caudata]